MCRHPNSNPRPALRALRALALVLALALLASGCTTFGGDPLDIQGNPIPPGTLLDNERYDDPEVLRAARTLIIVPFGVDPAESSGVAFRLLENTAVMASEEVVSALRTASRLQAVGFGRGDEEVDLTVYGRVVEYVRPSVSTDVIFGGKQRLVFTGEIYERATNRLVGAFHVDQSNPGREWYDDEETDLKNLSREAGKRIGAVLARRIGG